MDAFMTEQRQRQIVFDYEYLEHPMLLGNLTLRQAKDSCFYDRLQASPTNDQDYTFIYMVTGTGRVLIDKEELTLKEREYILLPPQSEWVLHNIYSFAPMRVLTLHIYSRDVITIDLGLSRWHGVDLHRPMLGTDDGVFDDLLAVLFKEIEHRDRFANVMVESLLRQIVIRICRADQPAQVRSAESPVTIDSRQELIYLMIRYMDENQLKLKELRKLSDLLGYSYSHLSRVFREEMGENLQTYWARKRNLRAKKLLQEGDLSITKIAEMLDYQSIHSFSKAFKKTVGLNPTEYQESYEKLNKALHHPQRSPSSLITAK